MLKSRLTSEVFTKHRLELFSDGVFAILLTLLVLELEVPHATGLASLKAAAPDIGLHAIAFIAIAAAWVSHYRALAILPRINPVILWANLLALFPVTLIPFALKIDARNATDPAGSLFLGLLVAAYSAALALFRLAAGTVLRDAPPMAAFNRGRAAAAALFAVAALSASIAFFPWFGGYWVILATVPIALLTPPAPVAETEGDATG